MLVAVSCRGRSFCPSCEKKRQLGRCAAEAVVELVRRDLGDEARPGIVVSILPPGTWSNGTRMDTC